MWLIVSAIPLVVAVFCIVSADSTRDEIKRMDKKLAVDVQNMRALQSKSASLSALCDNKDVASELIKLAEKFKYSDPVSSEATKKLELDLERILSEIETAVVGNSLNDISALCKKATITLGERDRICKLHKGR